MNSYIMHEYVNWKNFMTQLCTRFQGSFMSLVGILKSTPCMCMCRLRDSLHNREQCRLISSTFLEKFHNDIYFLVRYTFLHLSFSMHAGLSSSVQHLSHNIHFLVHFHHFHHSYFYSSPCTVHTSCIILCA